MEALKESLKLFMTGHMLLLSLSSIYSGLAYCFLSGVYSTAVGNTKMLGTDAKKFVGLVGILVGVGEVIGGSLFGLLGSRTTKRGTDLNKMEIYLDLIVSMDYGHIKHMFPPSTETEVKTLTSYNKMALFSNGID